MSMTSYNMYLDHANITSLAVKPVEGMIPFQLSELCVRMQTREVQISLEATAIHKR